MVCVPKVYNVVELARLNNRPIVDVLRALSDLRIRPSQWIGVLGFFTPGDAARIAAHLRSEQPHVITTAPPVSRRQLAGGLDSIRS